MITVIYAVYTSVTLAAFSVTAISRINIWHIPAPNSKIFNPYFTHLPQILLSIIFSHLLHTYFTLTSHLLHTFSRNGCPWSECHTDRFWKAYRWSYQKLRKIDVTCHDDSFGGMQDLAVVWPLVRSKATICHQVTRVTWVKQVKSSWIP